MIKATVQFDADAPGQVTVLKRCLGELRDAGIDLTMRPGSRITGDGPLFVSSLVAGGWLKGIDRPVVVLEKADDAAAYRTDYATYPHVVAVVKHGVLRPDLLMTSPRREHVSRITGEPHPPTQRMTLCEAEKYTSALTFGQYRRLAPMVAQDVDMDAPRSIDVLFAGRVETGDAAITAHRRACVDAMRSLPGRVAIHEGRELSGDAYRLACLDARVVVSPWGYGELCHRDYEALLCGCVLVKPDTRHVRTAGGVLDYALWCRPDFADLADVVNDALSRPRTEERQAGRDAACRLWHPSTVVHQVAELCSLMEGVY